MAQVQEYTELSLSLLDEKEETLKALADQYKGLTVDGTEDKEGFKALRNARITLKNERVAIENAAKALREPAIRFQKKVIEREKQLVAIIAPTEEALHAEEKRIEQLKEEARKEREMWEAKQLQDRLDKLAEYNYAADWVEVKHMTDDEFNTLLAHAKASHEEELRRQAEIRAEEERKRKEEEERLQREREELARLRAEQEAREVELRRQEEERQAKIREEQERLRAERERIEAERRAIEEEKRKAEEARRLEEARKEAAERARREEQERIKREAEEKAERERLAKLEAERQEALKPDKEKLRDYAANLMSVTPPDLSTPEANALLKHAVKKLHDLSTYIHENTSRL